MRQLVALPTARDEAWRYADHAALARLWPLRAPERMVVSAGAPFERVIMQKDGGVTQLDLTLEAGASAKVHAINLGGDYARIELAVTLGAGATFDLYGVQIGDDGQSLEIVAHITHAEPGATSRQAVKSVLAGKATGTYLGKILVAKGAQKTDAGQSSKALLLTRTATANTKPELEIHADDVKCAHGATVGELDRNALFYLESRGLAPDEARALLIEAFMADLIETISDPVGRDIVAEAVTARLHGLVTS